MQNRPQNSLIVPYQTRNIFIDSFILYFILLLSSSSLRPSSVSSRPFLQTLSAWGQLWGQVKYLLLKKVLFVAISKKKNHKRVKSVNVVVSADKQCFLNYFLMPT